MSDVMKFASKIEDKELRTKFMREVGSLHKGMKTGDIFDWEYLNDILNRIQA